MFPDPDQLLVLRQYCKDEAAFIQLRKVLVSGSAPASENTPEGQQPDPDLDCQRATPDQAQLLQGVAQATRQLLTTWDFTTAVNRALAILGKVTQVDRVYIFAAHPHPETGEPAISQRFEWVRDSISAQIDNPDLQNLTYTSHGFAEMYEILVAGHPVWYLVADLPREAQALLAPQGILSLLMVPIHINGSYWGFIGFDDCCTGRQWTKDEEAVLMIVAASLGGLIARQQTEQQLRVSEERLKSFFDATSEAVLVHERGTILDVNHAAEVLFGETAAGLIGQSVLELTAEASRFLIRERLRSPIDGEPFEAVGLRKDGSTFMSEVTDRGILYQSRAARVVGIRDITQRKHAEAALRDSEEKFSKAFCSSPDPMTISTLEAGRYIDVNQSFLNITGFSREEVIGQTSLDLNIWCNPADRVCLKQLLQTQEIIRNLECQFRKRSGEVVEMLLSADVIHLAGQPCLLCVARDITERKQAEQQLRQAAERDRLLGEIALRIRQSLDLDQILNTTVTEVRRFLQADRVFINQFDHRGRAHAVVESVDPRWPSILGWTTETSTYEEVQAMFKSDRIRVSNDTERDRLPPFLVDIYRRFHVKASMAVPIFQGDRFYGLLVVHQCSEPRQWEPTAIDLLKSLATQVAIALQQAELYCQVQTLNANLEQQVEERTAQLQQKMQELQALNQVKDDFLHAVSHDLRTPVMGTLLVLKNLLNRIGGMITISRSVLERMLDSSERQLNLINSLLEAHSSDVRGISLHYENIHLGSLVQSILTDLDPLFLKHQAHITNQIVLDLPPVTADPEQLRRVFENLLTNALNHNLPGLHITLTATVQAEMIRCTIEDDGVGMSQEQCDRLFNRYARGPNARHSTGIGLGLYLCRQIIMAHGGQIGVISAPGAGAQFWFTVPLAPIPSEPPSESSIG